MSNNPAGFVKNRLVKYINRQLPQVYIIDEFKKMNKVYRRKKINWDRVWRRKKELEYFFGKTVGYEDRKKKGRML